MRIWKPACRTPLDFEVKNLAPHVAKYNFSASRETIVVAGSSIGVQPRAGCTGVVSKNPAVAAAGS
jgi:hypothetical protein